MLSPFVEHAPPQLAMTIQVRRQPSAPLAAARTRVPHAHAPPRESTPHPLARMCTQCAGPRAGRPRCVLQICRNMYFMLSALLAIAHRMLWVRLSGCSPAARYSVGTFQRKLPFGKFRRSRP
jgi:hypothetical protein